MSTAVISDPHQQIRSLESIVYILAMVSVVIFFAGWVFFYFRKVKTRVLVQTRLFNKEIFMRDRLLFKKFAKKDTLETRDFLALTSDRDFMEHLWRKEVGYYEKLMTISQDLKLLRFLKLGSALFLALCLVLGYFLLSGVFKWQN